MRRGLLLCLLAIFGVILSSGTARAQEATGKIVGTVYDEQGAVIPGAKVTVTDTATGVTSTGVTNSEGYFEVPSLPIGTYSVTVEQQGFVKALTQSRKLDINQTLSFKIILKVGAPSQTVTVEAQVSGVETENPTVGGTVVGSEIQEAPLNGRNVLNLALLQPGVVQANSAVGGFSVAGGRPDSITYLLDGGLNNDLLSNGVVFNPNPDAVAEFRILTSNYTAEYGRNGGGIVTESLKPGTNAVHGSAYDYFRDGGFDSNSFFNNLNGIPRDNLHRHQFGGTVGGPISIPHVVNGHDKLFFFAAYQGQRQTQSVDQNDVTTFTPLELSGNFSKSNPDGSGTPDPAVVAFLSANPFFASPNGNAAQGIIDPLRINPVATKVIQANLIPTSPTGLITSVAPDLDNNNELDGRIDYAPTQNDKLYASFGGRRRSHMAPFNGADVSGYPDLTTTNSYFASITYARTFSASMLNEFSVSGQRNNILQDKPAASLPSPGQLGFGITPDLVLGPPQLSFDTGLTTGFSIQGPSNLVGNTVAFRDTFTMIRGNNTWKFGGGFSDYVQNMVFDFIGNSIFNFQGAGGNGSGNSFADFLLGIPNSVVQGPNAPSNIRQKQTYVFGQDEWHVRRNLTLTLGLRYEYASPKRDTRGRSFAMVPGKQSIVFPNAPLGLVFPGDSGVALGSNYPDKDNFAPRFGFAWDVRGNGKTSIRGGAGIFYDVLKAEDNFQFNGQPPFFADVTAFFPNVGPGQNTTVPFYSAPFTSAGLPANPFPSKPPTTNLDFIAAGFIPFTPVGAVFVNQHIHTPYTYQYNLSLQQELAPKLTGEVNYVGSSSKGLTGLVDINPFDLASVNTANPFRVFNPAALAASSAMNTFCSSFGAAVGAPTASECPFPISDGFDNVSFATYNGVQGSITKQVGENRFVGNSFFTLAYTYGRSIDNASGFRNNTSTVPFYNRSQFRGPSDFDATHRIVLSGGWELPFQRMWNSGPKVLLSGWNLYPIFSWQTGFPLTVNAQINPFGDSSQPGPSGAGDGFLANAAFSPGFTHVTILNPRLPGNHYFAKATFTGTLPANEPYGLPRGIFRGPGATNLDLSLAKQTKLYENVNLELRLDAFDALNHAEFANPRLNLLSGTFGRVTSTSTINPFRIVQIAAHLTF